MISIVRPFTPEKKGR